MCHCRVNEEQGRLRPLRTTLKACHFFRGGGSFLRLGDVQNRCIPGKCLMMEGESASVLGIRVGIDH